MTTRPQLGTVATTITVAERAVRSYAHWRSLRSLDRAREELEPLTEELRRTPSRDRQGRERWRLRDRVTGIDLQASVEWDGNVAYIEHARVRDYRHAPGRTERERRKRGQPPKDPGLLRSRTISMKVAPERVERWEQLARAEGETLTDWLTVAGDMRAELDGGGDPDPS